MKMCIFFYKKTTSFYKKLPIVIYKKNSMLQIVIYKKLNFWEEYTPLVDDNVQVEQVVATPANSEYGYRNNNFLHFIV